MKFFSSFSGYQTLTRMQRGLIVNLLIRLGKASFGVLFFAILVLIVAWLSQKCGKPPNNQDQNLLQNFIEWYAVFYTLALSLIVGQAWRKHNKINSTIDREADALNLLVQTSRLCRGNDLSKSLVLAVKSYVTSVRTLRSKDERTNTDSFEKMRTIRDIVGDMITNASVSDSVKSELIHQYNEAYDARGDRFDLVKQRLPFYIWFILAFFSLAWLWGFFWLQFNSDILNFYILGSTIFSITFIFFLAGDLDDPTSGFWMMNFDTFDSRYF